MINQWPNAEIGCDIRCAPPPALALPGEPLLRLVCDPAALRRNGSTASGQRIYGRRVEMIGCAVLANLDVGPLRTHEPSQQTAS